MILSYEQMKDLGAITSNAIRLLGNASALCLRSDARLSITKSIQRELYHLLPRKSFRKLAKVCLGKGFEATIKTRSETAKTLLSAASVEQNSRTCSVFSRPHHPLQETREPLGWLQSKVSKCQQLQPVSGSIQRPRQTCQRSPAANPSSHPVERPSHLTPGMMLHLKPLAVNHLPLVGRLKHCISNWVVISNDPWVLETVQGFHLDLMSAPQQLSVPPAVPHTKENMAVIDLEIQQMLENACGHPGIVTPRVL